MRRISMFVLSVAVLLGVQLSGGGLFVAAQEQGHTDHPAVGTWLVESDLSDAEFTPRLVTLAADGTASFVSGQQTTALGAWESMDDTTAVLTFIAVTNGPAYIEIRSTIDLASDAQSFTGTFTIEAVFDPAGGGTSGEIGPGTLTGTRITPTAPGTPTGSFEEFFPQPEGSPEASPVG